jgi:hypothetical protein
VAGATEDLDFNEIEDLNTPTYIPEPLGADDYEAL